MIGRKRAIMAAAVPFCACWMATAMSSDFTVLLAARFFVGGAVGVVSMAVPLFISESSPTHLRGALGAVNQLMVSSTKRVRAPEFDQTCTRTGPLALTATGHVAGYHWYSSCVRVGVRFGGASADARAVRRRP